jgi:hypothetical protein
VKSTEAGLSKNYSISITCEFRTKSAKSGALENSGQREQFMGLSSSNEVRRFAREAPCLLGISALSEVSEEC